MLVTVLTGCAGSTLYVPSKITLAEAPETLTKPCAIPVYVKSGNARVVFNAHATDRKNLITCGKRLKAVVGWYVKRDNSVKLTKL